MSKKKKETALSNPGGRARPSGSAVAQTHPAPAQDIEPVAERRPVPVFLIVLLVLLVYLGDMYVMEHGADVMGKAGPFPKLVYDPFRSYDEVVEKTRKHRKTKFSRWDGQNMNYIAALATCPLAWATQAPVSRRWRIQSG